MPARARRSVPGEQESFADDAVVTACPRCGGRDLPVTCSTCGGTGKVTLLPRDAPRASRVRLEMEPDEAKALLEGRPWPETVVRLAGALDRALR